MRAICFVSTHHLPYAINLCYVKIKRHIVNTMHVKDQVVDVFFNIFFTRPTDPLFLLENDCKHKNKWRPYALTLIY